MSKVLHTLVVVAALLWSSVCFAQCRILPREGSAAKASAVPPCHKQHSQPSQQKQQLPKDGKPCVDPASCVSAASQPEFTSLLDGGDVPVLLVTVLPIPLASGPLASERSLRGYASWRPPTSVLRI